MYFTDSTLINELSAHLHTPHSRLLNRIFYLHYMVYQWMSLDILYYSKM